MSLKPIKEALPIDSLYRGSHVHHHGLIVDQAKKVVNQFIEVINGKMISSDNEEKREWLAPKRIHYFSRSSISFGENKPIDKSRTFLELDLDENGCWIGLKENLTKLALGITETDSETKKVINDLLINLVKELKTLRLMAKNLETFYQSSKLSLFCQQNENLLKAKREDILADYKDWLEIAELYQKLLELREKHFDNEVQRQFISIVWLNQIKGAPDRHIQNGSGIDCLTERMARTISVETVTLKKRGEEMKQNEVDSEIPLPPLLKNLQNLASRAAAFLELLRVEEDVIYCLNHTVIKHIKKTFENDQKTDERLNLLNLVLTSIAPKKEKYIKSYFCQAKLLQEKLLKDLNRLAKPLKDKLSELEEEIKLKKGVDEEDLNMMICTKKIIETSLDELKQEMHQINAIIRKRERKLSEGGDSGVYEATSEQMEVLSIFNTIAFEYSQVKNESSWFTLEGLEYDQLKKDQQRFVFNHKERLVKLLSLTETLPDSINRKMIANFIHLAEAGGELINVRSHSEQLKNDLRKLKKRTDKLRQWNQEPQLSESSSNLHNT